jgi:hypothetical protein
MVRKLAFGFAILFGLVVASGWMPQTVTSMNMTPDGPERMMWGLYGHTECHALDGIHPLRLERRRRAKGGC